MRIDRPAVISKPIPLVPLVDVVFLLLMFFMLSTSFARFGQLDVSRGSAASGAAAGQARGGTPGVIVEISKGPEIRVNGSRVELGALVAKLDEFHGKGVRAGSVRVAPSAEVQDLVTVLELARTSKLRALSIRR